MNQSFQFLWHDYETFGTHPALDRPAQFAAIRTDEALEVIGEPMEWFCAPADDMLPHPMACLITGITPQQAARKGVIEAEFSRLIHDEMMQPGTCSAGYNSLKFDDEFSRHIFYRNFRDPYEREWKNGNSRFDLINLARMCYALRPDGIEWPINESGKPSFRLEHLTAANNIGHEGAHDALSDVQATIDFARLIRNRQSRLFDWALEMRNQKKLLRMLDILNPEPFLHSSGRIPPSRGCTSLFLPLAVYPDRPKWIIAVDLMTNPDALINSTAEIISDLVFTPAGDLPEGKERIPLKAIQCNKVPMLAPLATLKGVDTQRIALDPELCVEHASLIKSNLEKIRMKVMEVFGQPPGGAARDPDLMLYSGDFFSKQDRTLMNQVLTCKPDQFAKREWTFKDPRLETMLFRYRARNYPQTLSAEEAKRWLDDRRQRLYQPPVQKQPGLKALQGELSLLRENYRSDGRANRILDQLEDWYRELDLELSD
jgi:exodeoxyribonuclease-1